MFELLQYDFMVRGIEAGAIVALVAPLIGLFLVLRRYALIADTLAHVSLAGIAFGLLMGVSTLLSSLVTVLIASFGIERLRSMRGVYGDSALALFLSGSLALALVLISLANGLNANILSYLFGSIFTVTEQDIITMLMVGLLVFFVTLLFFKEFVYTTFDEDAARASGIPVQFINTVMILLASLVVALSIPVVGVLLISALLVIPAVTALQWRASFVRTLCIAELVSLFSVFAGIFVSYRFDIAASGAIVLIMLALFLASILVRRTS